MIQKRMSYSGITCPTDVSAGEWNGNLVQVWAFTKGVVVNLLHTFREGDSAYIGAPKESVSMIGG